MANSNKALHIRYAQKQIKRERVKKTIIAALKQAIKEIGYKNITMKIIAEKSALSRATLYNYFTTKEALMIEIGIEAYIILEKKFQNAIKNHPPGIEQIEAIGNAFINFHIDFPFYRKALDYSGECIKCIKMHISKNKPIIHKDGIDNLDQILEKYMLQENKFKILWISSIQQAIDIKSIRQDISAQTLAMTIGTIMTGMLDELEIRDNLLKNIKLPRQEIIKLTLDFIKKGISPSN